MCKSSSQIEYQRDFLFVLTRLTKTSPFLPLLCAFTHKKYVVLRCVSTSHKLDMKFCELSNNYFPPFIPKMSAPSTFRLDYIILGVFFFEFKSHYRLNANEM